MIYLKKNYGIWPKILAIIGIVISFFALSAGYNELQRNRKIDMEISKLAEEAEKLKKDTNFLQEKIKYFDSVEFKEKEAKEKLNFQKEGEKVVVIRPSQSEIENNLGELRDEEEKNIKEDNYVKWWKLFF